MQHGHKEGCNKVDGKPKDLFRSLARIQSERRHLKGLSRRFYRGTGGHAMTAALSKENGGGLTRINAGGAN